MSDYDVVGEEAEPTMAAIAVRDEGAAVVAPADLTDVAAAYAAYQAMTIELLDESDYQEVQGRRYKKKSAWRKMAVAYNVTLELVEKEIARDDEGRVIYAEFVMRATAPNGRYADGWGECSRTEKCCAPGCKKGGRHTHCEPDCPGWVHFSHANHDIPATAMTRASNRASSDLFGMGEVSAEELGNEPQQQRGGHRQEGPTEVKITSWKQLIELYDEGAGPFSDDWQQDGKTLIEAILAANDAGTLRGLKQRNRELSDRLWDGVVRVVQGMAAASENGRFPPASRDVIVALWIEQFPELVEGSTPAAADAAAEPEVEGSSTESTAVSTEEIEANNDNADEAAAERAEAAIAADKAADPDIPFGMDSHGL